MLISIDTNAIILIIIIPTAILFLCAIALSIGGIIGDFFKSYAISKIEEENERLLNENYNLREKLRYEKP